MTSNYPRNFILLPRWILVLHFVQLVFAIIILGLDAYGIKWIPYNVLIFSLVVCLCTLFVSIYLLATQLQLHNLYNPIVALAFHIWMLLFWVVDMGLVANLARIWSGPSCSYYYGYGYACDYYFKRGLIKRDSTTYTAYYGALAAGAVFAGVQLVTWAISAGILALHFNKHRANAANTTTTITNNQAMHQSRPPQYAPSDNNTIPMEKYNHDPAQQTPQPQYAQPAQYQQQPQQNFTAPYPQDPVQRQDTVSPVSQVAHHAPVPNGNVSELSSPQHTGQPQSYPSNVSELSVPQQQQDQRYDHNMPELASSR